MSGPLQVLFQGYAPVHGLCFLPLHDHLVDDPRIEISFTGGYRHGRRPHDTYADATTMYGLIGISPDRVIDTASAAQRRWDVLFSASTHPIVPFERCGSKIQIFHGISMRNRGVRRENLAYDHLWLVGPFMRRLFSHLDLLAEGDPKGVPIGFPKTDPLVDGSPSPRPTLERLGLDGELPVVLYAPTGAAGNSMELHGLDVATAISRSGLAELVVKYHDHPHGDGGPSAQQLRALPRVTVVDDVDIVPLLTASDVLITDASSVANEFVLLDRPILFMDVPKVFTDTTAKGAHVDYNARATGLVVPSPYEVTAALEKVLGDPSIGSAERRERAVDLYYNPGRATATAVDWFEQEFM